MAATLLSLGYITIAKQFPTITKDSGLVSYGNLTQIAAASNIDNDTSNTYIEKYERTSFSFHYRGDWDLTGSVFANGFPIHASVKCYDQETGRWIGTCIGHHYMFKNLDGNRKYYLIAQDRDGKNYTPIVLGGIWSGSLDQDTTPISLETYLDSLDHVLDLRFEEISGNPVDSSPTGLTLVPVNGVTPAVSSGFLGSTRGVRFNGVDEMLTGSGTNTAGTKITSRTIGTVYAFFKISDNINGSDAIFSVADNNNNFDDYFYTYVNASNYVTLYIETGTSGSDDYGIQSQVKINRNVPILVAFVQEGDGSIPKLYMEGHGFVPVTIFQTGSGTPQYWLHTPQPPTNISVGALHYGSYTDTDGTNHFDGDIYNIGVTNKIMTEEELDNLGTALRRGFTYPRLPVDSLLAPNFIGYWTMDNRDDLTTIYNELDSAHDFVVTGSPIVDTGRIGDCLSFTDDNSMLLTANSSANDWMPFGWTYAGWFIDKTKSNGFLFGNKNIIVRCSSFPSLTWDNEGGTGTFKYWDISNHIIANEWFHLAVTYDGTQHRFYINSIDITPTYTTGSSANVFNNTGLTLGGYEFSDGSQIRSGNVKVDEFRAYNRALSQEEIVVTMGGALPG